MFGILILRACAPSDLPEPAAPEAIDERRIDPMTPEEHREALRLLQKVCTDVDAFEPKAARSGLQVLLNKYKHAWVYIYAERLEGEIAVIGKEERALEVERWYQGSEADLRSARATLYVFWEVWDPRCKQALPRLEKAYERFRERGLAVIGLTKQLRDATDEAVEQFIADQDITYPIARETGAMTDHYGVRGVPAAALVANGVVVWRGHPDRLTDEILAHVL